MEAGEGTVLARDGTSLGGLLRGVLDLDLPPLADQVMDGPLQSLTIGLSVGDEQAIAAGFVCGGGVELLAQRLDTVPVALWRAVEAGRPATVVTVCSGPAAGATAVVDDAGLYGDQRLARLVSHFGRQPGLGAGCYRPAGVKRRGARAGPCAPPGHRCPGQGPAEGCGIRRCARFAPDPGGPGRSFARREGSGGAGRKHPRPGGARSWRSQPGRNGGRGGRGDIPFQISQVRSTPARHDRPDQCPGHEVGQQTAGECSSSGNESAPARVGGPKLRCDVWPARGRGAAPE
jgi:hypothetical protein